MVLRHRRWLALLGCLLAAFAAGCGADEERAGAPLPRPAVAELDKQLRSIEQRYAFGDGACADIEADNRRSVRRTLATLPEPVDRDVRRALRQSFDRLFELARRHCDSDKPVPAPVLPTPPAAPPPIPAPATTATTQTDTTQADTTDTATTGRTQTSKTSPLAPTSPSTTPKRRPRQRDQPAPNRPRDRPGTTDSPAADPGSGGTPAPEPRRRPARR